MVMLDLNITIDDFIAETDSVVEVFLNDNLLTRLNGKTRSFSSNISLARDKNHIVIKRKYLKPTVAKKIGLIKSIISSITTLLIMAYSTIEPFECLYECEEIFEVYIVEKLSKMQIHCIQNNGDKCPTFFIESKGCELKSKKALFMSREELKSVYDERKKMIYIILLLYSVILTSILLPSLIHQNSTTVLFVAVIFILILVCSIYSLKNLRKQYLELFSETSRKMQ